MSGRRSNYATSTTTVKEEVVPLLIHDPSAGPGEPQYTYATFATVDEAEAAVATLAAQQGVYDETLDDANEVFIDEHGRVVTIQQWISDEDDDNVEEVEADEESDDMHAFLHIVPPSSHEAKNGEECDLSVCPDEATVNRSKTFYCHNCGNCYSAAGSLKLHVRACLREKHEVPPEERKCKICDKVFNSVSYLKEHILRHTGQGPRRCLRCYRKFVDDTKYKAHMETHKQQDKLDAEAKELAAQNGGKKVVLKEFTCSFCSQSFTVVFNVGEVKRRYACDSCREKYSNAEMLRRHKQENSDKREYHCDRCGRKFVFEGFLQRHIPSCDGTIKRRRDMK